MSRSKAAWYYFRFKICSCRMINGKMSAKLQNRKTANVKPERNTEKEG
jgi:hypothetical protein